MATYLNTNLGAPISEVEFSTTKEGDMAYFHIRHVGQVEEVKRMIAPLGQVVVGEATVSGHPILVTRGPKNKTDILRALNSLGWDFNEQKTTREFNPWKWRGHLSNVGQLGQLTSAFVGAGKSFDSSVGMFAILNLAANMSNIIFGAQNEDDPNRLAHIKTVFNEDLKRYLPAGTATPDLNENYIPKHKANTQTRQSLWDFMERNSVQVGEIGLRYLGSAALVVPAKNWKTVAESVVKLESPVKAWNIVKNPNPMLLYAGLTYLVGKHIGFLAKTPDPYAPTPKTPWDKFQEKVAFRLSSLVEFGAALAIASNGLGRKVLKDGKFANKLDFNKPAGTFTGNVTQKLKSITPEFMHKAPFIQRDWFGGIGGLLFATAFMIRFSAPYGSKDVNMDNLNAHIAEGLSRIPHEKLPQLVADTTSMVLEQFPSLPLEYNKVYTDLADTLYRDYRIALSNAADSTKEVVNETKGLPEPSYEKPTNLTAYHESLDVLGQTYTVSK